MRNTKGYLDNMGKEDLEYLEELKKRNETKKKNGKTKRITIQSTTRSRGSRSVTLGEGKE